MKDFTYQEVVNKATQIKEILGPTPTVYLRDGHPPYAKAAKFEAGGTVRLGVNTSGWFSAFVQGIECKWAFDLEDYSANGTGTLAPRVEAIREAITALTGTARTQFREWINDVAAKLNADAAEVRARADSLATKAAILSDLAAEPA